MRLLWCALALAAAATVIAAPDNVIANKADEYVNSTVTARDFSCRAKCPLVVQCLCRNCVKGACVFDTPDCTRWCSCECENEKKFSGGI